MKWQNEIINLEDNFAQTSSRFTLSLDSGDFHREEHLTRKELRRRASHSSLLFLPHPSICLVKNQPGLYNWITGLYTRNYHSIVKQPCVCAQLLSHVKLFCNPMDYSPPGSSVHGIFQARILEWVAISYSRGSSWPWDQNCIGKQILYHWAT